MNQAILFFKRMFDEQNFKEKISTNKTICDKNHDNTRWPSSAWDTWILQIYVIQNRCSVAKNIDIFEYNRLKLVFLSNDFSFALFSFTLENDFMFGFRVVVFSYLLFEIVRKRMKTVLVPQVWAKWSLRSKEVIILRLNYYFERRQMRDEKAIC